MLVCELLIDGAGDVIRLAGIKMLGNGKSVGLLCELRVLLDVRELPVDAESWFKEDDSVRVSNVIAELELLDEDKVVGSIGVLEVKS